MGSPWSYSGAQRTKLSCISKAHKLKKAVWAPIECCKDPGQNQNNHTCSPQREQKACTRKLVSLRWNTAAGKKERQTFPHLGTRNLWDDRGNAALFQMNYQSYCTSWNTEGVPGNHGVNTHTSQQWIRWNLLRGEKKKIITPSTQV